MNLQQTKAALGRLEFHIDYCVQHDYPPQFTESHGREHQDADTFADWARQQVQNRLGRTRLITPESITRAWLREFGLRTDCGIQTSSKRRTTTVVRSWMS